MIFAAGFGTRLKPLTDAIPKALVQVKGKPVIKRVIDSLNSLTPLDQVVVNTHYLSEQVDAYFQGNSFGFPVYTSFEKDILGTGGGLYQAQKWLKNADFWVQNSDILCDADLKKMLEVHKRENALVTMAIQNREEKSKLMFDSGSIFCGTDKEGKKDLFRLPIKGQVKSMGFCGIHLISSRIFELYQEPFPFSIIDLYKDLAKQGEKIIGWDIGDSYWIDIGTPETLAKANLTYSPS